MDSKLQIISGVFRGRKLRLPPDARPTQNRARIALFNMLESGIIAPGDHFNVWDAFAGSGAFGLECLSRYPNATVVFTDTSATSIKTVRDNLATLNIGPRATVVHADAIFSNQKYVSQSDLIFIDAPYSNPELGLSFVAGATQYAKSGTILIWEQEVTNKHEPNTTQWDILRDKTYGRARFLILQRK